MIFQLAYTSQACPDFWPNDLFAIVEKSRRNNAARQITGMLLFHDGRFLQLLEGPEASVRECFAIVEADPRHTSVRILFSRDCAERDFPDWTMGFEQIEDAWSLPRAWSTVLESRFNSEAAFQDAAAAEDLLTTFREAGERLATVR